jgi:hypothetical protein
MKQYILTDKAMNQINKGNYGPGEGGFQNLILELRGNLTENTLSINYAMMPTFSHPRTTSRESIRANEESEHPDTFLVDYKREG